MTPKIKKLSRPRDVVTNFQLPTTNHLIRHDVDEAAWDDDYFAPSEHFCDQIQNLGIEMEAQRT